STRERARPRCVGARASAAQLDLVALDQRVRKERLAHPSDELAHLVGVGGLDLELYDTPDTRVRDRKAELAQGVSDRLALRVQDSFLGSDEHRGLHRSTTSGSAR